MSGTLVLVLLVVLGFWVLVGLAAAFITLFGKESDQTARALEVLRLVARYGLGASALVAVIGVLDHASTIDLITK